MLVMLHKHHYHTKKLQAFLNLGHVQTDNNTTRENHEKQQHSVVKVNMFKLAQLLQQRNVIGQHFTSSDQSGM